MRRNEHAGSTWLLAQVFHPVLFYEPVGNDWGTPGLNHAGSDLAFWFYFLMTTLLAMACFFQMVMKLNDSHSLKTAIWCLVAIACVMGSLFAWFV